MPKQIRKITKIALYGFLWGAFCIFAQSYDDAHGKPTLTANIPHTQGIKDSQNSSQVLDSENGINQSDPSLQKKGDIKPTHSQDKCQLLSVWNFDSGINTNQNGDYNHFSAGASKVDLSLASFPHRGSSGRSLKISYSKTDNGYCGVWMHLYDEERMEEQNRFLDVSDYPNLSFWVRGENGGENFAVQMANPKWLKKEDSRSAGLVSDYLGGPVSKDWQEVIIPYEKFGLKNFMASSFVLNFTKGGNGIVYIDDINFKNTGECPVPFSKDNGNDPLIKPHHTRAMWVWHTEPLLLDISYRENFFAFCEEYGINEVFLQLPYSFEYGFAKDVKCIIRHPDELRNFIKQSRSKGILMHSLDGYPEFVLEDQHPRVLSQIRALIEFNQDSAPEERYFGIHLDNEPYQLLGFEGSGREMILIQFLDLNRKIMNLLKENNSEMVSGVDIPFWFDEAKDKNGLPKYLVSYNGEDKNVAYHLIDIVDNVGVMDYRNFAGGADGIIKHGQGEVDYANSVGKKIYIGVETFMDNPMKISFIYATTPRTPLSITSKFETFRIRVINTPTMRLIGLVQPKNSDNKAVFEDALIKLFQLYGQTPGTQIKISDDAKLKAEAYVKNDPKYSGFKPFTLKDENRGIEAIGFETTEHMLPKISFAGKTKSQMEKALSEVAEAFADKKSFVGFAIHYYKTYRVMPD